MVEEKLEMSRWMAKAVSEFAYGLEQPTDRMINLISDPTDWLNNSVTNWNKLTDKLEWLAWSAYQLTEQKRLPGLTDLSNLSDLNRQTSWIGFKPDVTEPIQWLNHINRKTGVNQPTCQLTELAKVSTQIEWNDCPQRPTNWTRRLNVISRFVVFEWTPTVVRNFRVYEVKLILSN